MASFLGLFNEIKINALDVTALDDIENFALCCKLVHDLAGKTWKQHRANKCTYSSFCFIPAWTEGHPCLKVYRMLRDMSEDRRLRLYPKLFTIENFTITALDPGTEKSIEVRNEVRRIADSILNSIGSPYLDKDEI